MHVPVFRAVPPVVLGLLAAAGAAAAQDVPFRVDTLASGLEKPSALVFLPDGRGLLADRGAGTISLLDVARGGLLPLEGVPPSYTGNLEDDAAGVHDVVLHPRYEENGWIFVSYTEGDSVRSRMVVDRLRLRGSALRERERVFSASAWSEDQYHYGGRMAFLEGRLYVTVSDRHHDDLAQDLSTHAGKIVRLEDDGRVPADNPFVGVEGALPEIWSRGHRNPLGLAVRPGTTELWSHEHGPRHGDEVNLVRRGANYGWPVVSYGWEYDGGPVGQGIPALDGMEPAVWVWTPVVAPSGMAFYRGDAFPAWRGSLFTGAMSRARPHLNRLVLRDGQIVLEERLLLGALGRVRLVAEGPDGFLYLGTDGGQLLRLRPVGDVRTNGAQAAAAEHSARHARAASAQARIAGSSPHR
jgi:glucose/arabinose dehydrogenase